MSHFHIVHPSGLLYRFMHNMLIFERKTMKFGKHVSMIVCHHICCIEFVTENKDVFLLDYHIWKFQNLNNRISYIQ